jgi:hypothetical protein
MRCRSLPPHGDVRSSTSANAFQAQHPWMRTPSKPLPWLQRAETIAEFVAAPVGKYVASSSFLYFLSATKLRGFALWGCPTAADVRALHRAMRLHSDHATAAHASLVDMSGLVSVDPESFDIFADGLQARYDDMARTLRKQAHSAPRWLSRRDGPMRLMAAARSLRTSERTLQRRLQSANTSFAARRECAVIDY